MSGAAPALPPILVMGKGGVGKTTVAAALAALAAERQGRAILVEFGGGVPGARALRGVHGVTHLVVRPDEALRRSAAPLFGSAALARLVLDNFAMRPLLRAAPAIHEVAMLDAVRQIVAEHPGARVVVDMPATGHGVAWLRTARQGRDFLGAGPLYELCAGVARDLVAPGRAAPVVVTLPEPLVLQETVELCEALGSDPGLPVSAVVVNRLPPPLPEEALRQADALAGAGAALGALREVLRARSAQRAEAEQAVAALALGAPRLLRVPLSPVDPETAEVARCLGPQWAS